MKLTFAERYRFHTSTLISKTLGNEGLLETVQPLSFNNVATRSGTMGDNNIRLG